MGSSMYMNQVTMNVLVACPVAQAGERQTSELTGGESPVRAASCARYLLTTGVVSDLDSGRIDDKVM